jgi:hypothetical protein
VVSRRRGNRARDQGAAPSPSSALLAEVYARAAQ